MGERGGEDMFVWSFEFGAFSRGREMERASAIIDHPNVGCKSDLNGKK